ERAGRKASLGPAEKREQRTAGAGLDGRHARRKGDRPAVTGGLVPDHQCLVGRRAGDLDVVEMLAAARHETHHVLDLRLATCRPELRYRVLPARAPSPGWGQG